MSPILKSRADSVLRRRGYGECTVLSVSLPSCDSLTADHSTFCEPALVMKCVGDRFLLELLDG
jgi:hypothetical protein